MKLLNQEVENVLNGMSADDRRARESPVSFTKNLVVRAHFAQAVRVMVTQIETNAPPLAHGELTGLIHKLATYCNGAGWQRPDNIHTLDAFAPVIADAIRNDRSLLAGPASIQQIIDTTLRLQTPPSPPVVIARADDPRFELVELTHPDHLMAQSKAVLECCVGVLYNEAALAEKNIREGSPESKQYLHYDMKIRDGSSRLFSFKGPDETYATIEYDTKTHNIRLIEAAERNEGGEKTRTIEKTAVYFRPFCQALHRLSEIIPIEKINGLPVLPVNQALMRDGSISAFSGKMTPDTLLAHVAVNNLTSPEDITRLALSPRLTLDVTYLSDLSLLPVKTEANLISSASHFNAPNIRQAGHIRANRAKSFNAPQLLEAWDIQADSAHTVNLTQLKKARAVELPSAKVLYLPELREAEDIKAPIASVFEIPRLKIARNIVASKAEIFKADCLKKSKDIFAPLARIFHIPLLQFANDIDASGADEFHAAELRKAQNIDAVTATTFNTPKLCLARHINADTALNFHIPLLRVAENIHAECAERFYAPALRKAKDIYADVAKYFSAMQLNESGAIYAPKATYFSTPDLHMVSTINAESAVDFEGPKDRARLPGLTRVKLLQAKARNDVMGR